MKLGKRYKEVSALVDKTKVYEPKEALELLVQTAKAKFDESVEIHVRLGVDGRSADQQVRGTVVLPAGTGKTKKVLVIAKGDKADEATKLGADIVGGDEIITKIQGGWVDFDVCTETKPRSLEGRTAVKRYHILVDGDVCLGIVQAIVVDHHHTHSAIFHTGGDNCIGGGEDLLVVFLHQQS